MFDVGVLTNLLLGAKVALDAALDVRSKLKRGSELFFLFHTMRAPVGTVHEDLFVG